MKKCKEQSNPLTPLFGKSFVMLPEEICIALNSTDKMVARKALFQLLFIASCHQWDGQKVFNDETRRYRRGELIISGRKYTERLGLKKTVFYKTLHLLGEEGFLETVKIDGGSHIRLTAYQEFLRLWKKEPTREKEPNQTPELTEEEKMKAHRKALFQQRQQRLNMNK